MFNTRAEPALSPAHRAISARSFALLCLAAIDLQPRTGSSSREKRRRWGGKDGDEGTHAHVCAASGSRGKKGAFSPRVTRATPEFVAPDWHERGPREASPRAPDTRQIPAAFCTYKNSVRASICIFKQTHRRAEEVPFVKMFPWEYHYVRLISNRTCAHSLEVHVNCYINDGYNHWGYAYPAIAHCSNINPLWPSNISAVAMRICPMTVDIR